jgi:2-C-methyl-D-erythritol 4-phosphate cytidylyltransferase
MNRKSAPPTSFLLLSGGVGARSEHHEPKQFYELAGHPMIAHSIIAAIRIEAIEEIVVNAPKGYEDRTRELMEHYCGTKPFKVVKCGASRQQSARILADAARNENILLHEAARPLIGPDMLQELLDCPNPNVGFCFQIPFSMCRIDPKTKRITKGVSRAKVFDIQLPQKFGRETFLNAHKLAYEANKAFTEDAILVLKMTNEEVLSLQGSSKNRKITTAEDFIIAEQIMKGN